ncbi:hypothetical protein XO10_03255 [Marinitoga sp. 1135]|uniref:Uncharacterized protein n=1 Tax=Marinitoga piezophila (strain DSM 14283 / JCM 11233 / KA3) TaxID=443254 RepID=H2J618_MARPK|nr:MULTISPECIES: hypothetical protein [Marinitoga]AEX85079.1 hypothetical protein Marpi_0641 [Marinitoga piezophila KA3]APT75586.1 hypothetical protein LN42_03655 [Marinitoga sp. 1137]NUU95294.1 hypothetical protein [Marinitoga sp. 1135]NUU97228.1 hypothetical protein [Marinitoga sp. 1138]
MIDEKKLELINMILDGENVDFDENLEEDIAKYKSYVRAYFLTQESYIITEKYKSTIISKIIVSIDAEE